MPKPSILKCYFFPNEDNEVYVLNMIRTCKKTLDIAIFVLTNYSIAAAIQEVFQRGIKVRIIADDESCQMWGNNIQKLASLGIPCKTDNSIKYLMHHKFAVIDNSVVVTGSFNWTAQAVRHNQENILFFENKPLAQQYTDEFNKLWNDFHNIIDQKEALRKVQEEETKRRIEKERQDKERAERDAIKAKEREASQKLKEEAKAQREKEKQEAKIQREKEKAELKAQRQKEKEKEIAEAKLQREKEKAEARAKKEKEYAEAKAKKEKEIAEAKLQKEKEKAEARAKKEKEYAEAKAKKEKEYAEAKAKKEKEYAEARAKKEKEKKEKFG